MTEQWAALGVGRTRAQLPVLLALGGAYAAIAVTVYLAAGLGEWRPQLLPVSRTLPLAIGFLFLPSLAEELLWRWLIIQPTGFRSPAAAIGWIALSTALFTAAHPLAAWLFVPHAWPTFTHPAFLAIVGLLGVTCGVAYVLSRSIWPPVALHWLTVLAWKFLLAGPFVLLGR